ncbi:hypothetical protein [Streptomyces sp. NPDC051662]|uniref:hypothetical protein n=1 Tax=Streptomyces sp. NPDC051662 TaxID=3154750 RepID=UPI003435C49B
MADAQRTTVEKQVVETKKIPSFTLTLTEEEAMALVALSANVKGNAENSPRKHTDAVYYALKSAGVSTYGNPILDQLSGSLRWLNEPKTSYLSF